MHYEAVFSYSDGPYLWRVLFCLSFSHIIAATLIIVIYTPSMSGHNEYLRGLIGLGWTWPVKGIDNTATKKELLQNRKPILTLCSIIA